MWQLTYGEGDCGKADCEEGEWIHDCSYKGLFESEHCNCRFLKHEMKTGNFFVA